MSNVSYSWSENDRIGDLGGFASVYRAIKLIDGLEIPDVYAVKKLATNDVESINRFQKEVRLLNNLDHPRVVKVEGFKLTSEPYFYAMPMYKSSLRSCIEEYKDDYVRLKRVVNEIFDGVDYMHQQGVVHRDIKPENILINSDTDLVISDLGLGVNVNSDSTRMTLTGQGMGTLWYLAPEQFMDAKHVDERADIFSLGRTISELFGMPRGGYDLEILPPGIRHVIQKSTQNSRERRYSSIDEFRTAFNLAMDAMMFGVQRDNTKSLLASIVQEYSDGIINPDTVRRFCESIVQFIDDRDLVHETLMQLPTPVLEIMEQIDLDIARTVFQRFSDHITSQGWGFDYTDKIGRQCSSYYSNSHDSEIRAQLIYTIANVGISHNRWYVMDLASDLLYDVEDSSESLILLDKLQSLNIERLNLISSRLNSILQRLT